MNKNYEQHKKHCVGCRNNIYNCGDRNCWHLKNAKVVTKYKIHMDAPMGERKNFKKVRIPDCFYGGGYSGDRHAYVSEIPATAR